MCGQNGFDSFWVLADRLRKLVQEQAGTFLLYHGYKEKKVKTPLSGYFEAWCDIIVKRAYFNKWYQGPSESINTFI